MRIVSWTFLSMALVACGSSAAPEPTVAPPPTSVVPRWELHEWGLIGLTLGDAPSTLAAAGVGPSPAAAPGPTTVGVDVPIDGRSGVGAAYAPVVYVQLLDDTPEITFDLRVDLTHDAIVEAWPTAAIDEHGASWSGVHATRATGPCGAVYPTAGDAFCRTTGTECEAAVGASYESSDGACLAVGDAHADFLLYRARIDRSALPYEITREGETVRVVGREGATAGRIVRIRRTFDAPGVSVASFDTPAVGVTIDVPELSAGEAEATLADLARGMTDEGLSEPEATAFRTGWRDAIVPEDTPTRFPAEARAALPCGARPASDAIYYWIHGETAQHVLPLVVTPAPTAVRRALLVRVSLDPALPGDVGQPLTPQTATTTGRGSDRAP